MHVYIDTLLLYSTTPVLNFLFSLISNQSEEFMYLRLLKCEFIQTTVDAFLLCESWGVKVFHVKLNME